jgi:hypothetical protein
MITTKIKPPSLSEVIEYFKDAVSIICLSNGKLVLYNTCVKDIYLYFNQYWFDYLLPDGTRNYCKVWCKHTGNYAQIFSSKTLLHVNVISEEHYAITEENLKILYNKCGTNAGQKYLEELFPNIKF